VGIAFINSVLLVHVSTQAKGFSGTSCCSNLQGLKMDVMVPALLGLLALWGLLMQVVAASCSGALRCWT